MGTKIQYPHKSLPISPKHFSAHQLDDWDSLRKNRELIGTLHKHCVNEFWDLLGRMLKPHQTESIRKTMLKQEHIFQQQVRELHRLYSVQRMLMNELKQTKFWGCDIKNLGFLNFRARSVIDIGPSSRERSVSCSGEMLKMPKGFDLERPAAAAVPNEEDMSTDVSDIDEDQTGPSTHNGINIDDKFSGIELTLSIGGSIGEKRSPNHKQKCSLKLEELRDIESSAFVKTSKGEEENILMASSSANFNRKSKQSH